MAVQRNMNPKRCPMPTQDPSVRKRNFDEVALGYTYEMAVEEARRCLNCPTKPCTTACPVSIDIPAFIERVVSPVHCLPYAAVYVRRKDNAKAGVSGARKAKVSASADWNVL